MTTFEHDPELLDDEYDDGASLDADLDDAGPAEHGAYLAASATYRERGWTSPLPLPPGRKSPPPDGRTGWTAPDASPADSWSWATEPPTRPNAPDYRGTDQLCLRMPVGVVGIDVDDYAGKGGAATLAEAERRWGPLPATYRSTSRGVDSRSAILYFRVPEGTVLRGGIAFRELGLGGIETIQRQHRYAVVWPSVHPERGTPYLWFYGAERCDGPPPVEVLPMLPDAWIEGLRAEGREAAGPASNAQVRAFEDEHGSGPTPGRIRGVIETFERDARAGSRHDAGRDAACMGAREARAGHYGAGQVRAALRDVFVAAITDPHKSSPRTPAEAHREFASVWAWAVSQAMTETVEQCRARYGEPFGSDGSGGGPGGTGSRKLGQAQPGALGQPAQRISSASPASDNATPAPAAPSSSGTSTGSRKLGQARPDVLAASTPLVDRPVTASAQVTPPEGWRPTVVGDDDQSYRVFDDELGRMRDMTEDEIELHLAHEAERKLREDVDRRKRDLRITRLAQRELDDELRPVEPLSVAALEWSAIANVKPPKMRVRKLIAESAVTWLSGRSGSYKSFLGVALAMSIATGRPVCGHDEWSVSGTLKVLYVAAEGPAGVSIRAQAYAAHHGLGPEQLEGRIILYPKRVDLRSERARQLVRDYVEARDIGMVVYDTWHKVTPGLDDSSRQEVGEIMSFLDELRDDYGVESLVVDHTGHAGERTTGSSSKIDDADCSLIIKMPGRERTADQQRTLVVDKLKDAETTGAWDLHLVPEPRVVDHEGNPSRVLAVGSISGGDGDIHGDGDWQRIDLPEDVVSYTGSGRSGLSVVARLVMAHGRGESGVTRAEVLKRYRAAMPDLNGDLAFSRVQRAWDALHALGRLSPTTGSSSPTAAHAWAEK